MYEGKDILAVVVAAFMILGPMFLGATHAADMRHTATAGEMPAAQAQ